MDAQVLQKSVFSAEEREPIPTNKSPSRRKPWQERDAGRAAISAASAGQSKAVFIITQKVTNKKAGDNLSLKVNTSESVEHLAGARWLNKTRPKEKCLSSTLGAKLLAFAVIDVRARRHGLQLRPGSPPLAGINRGAQV